MKKLLLISIGFILIFVAIFLIVNKDVSIRYVESYPGMIVVNKVLLFEKKK